MKDKSSFRLVLIGFLTGVVFSGLILLCINVVQASRNQNSVFVITPITNNKFENVIRTNSPGLIDLNVATIDDLKTLPGIGEAKAKSIIDFREKYGLFEEVAELTYVPGIGKALFESIQDLVIIN